MTNRYPGYPTPAPGYYPPPPPPPQNGFGTAGFVLGLLGLLFSFIPLIGIIAWPLVLLGIIFAGLGLSRARHGRATNKGLSIAGLVCSLIGLLVCIIYAAAFGAAVTNTGGAPSASSATAGGAPAENVAGIGDEVHDGSFSFVVTEVETGIERLGEGYLVSEAQGAYTLVHVTVTNVDDEAQLFSDSNQKLVDAQGRQFDAATGVAVMYLPDSQAFLNNINPGNHVDGVLVFDLPDEVAPTAIDLNDSLFSDGVRVRLSG
jgi:hypothetical protein